MHKPEKIRNIAIIAHIDHGKTTLLNELLKQAHIFKEHEKIADRAMDSLEQEKERGITISSKHTSIYYNDDNNEDYKINIIDTPGHADFSSEVERILGMVNSVLLIVDAQDGPMPQTRFVLSKSLKIGLKPIVVLNKIDRPNADPDRVLNETFDLFVELGANDEQLDFKYCYASALKGYAQKNINDKSDNLKPMFELIVNHVPAPTGSIANPFLIQSSTITHDDFLGRQACGRILEGQIKKGDLLAHLDKHGNQTKFNITKIQGYLGLEKVEMDIAGAGDIVCIAGIEDVTIGDTLCDPEHIIHLPPIEMEEPTVSIDILVNDGPFAGKSGKHVTFNKIKDRLYKERRSNISYQITEPEKTLSKITVAGRGELHLGILLETMRREGYEFCISKPQVILKIVSNQKHEPFSKVFIEVPEEYSGAVIEQLSKRKGEMQQLNVDEQKITHLEFLVPTRGIMGYRNEFLTTTRGLGILNSVFNDYAQHKGEIIGRVNGALVSICAGKANGYACFNLENRGRLFTKPGDEVYEGMIVGENNKENDLIVNITKSKQLTNVRAAGTDENIVLTPPRKFTLEEALCYINDDELIEVTPDSIRLRKKYLKEIERKSKKR